MYNYVGLSQLKQVTQDIIYLGDITSVELKSMGPQLFTWMKQNHQG